MNFKLIACQWPRLRPGRPGPGMAAQPDSVSQAPSQAVTEQLENFEVKIKVQVHCQAQSAADLRTVCQSMITGARPLPRAGAAAAAPGPGPVTVMVLLESWDSHSTT